MLERNVADKLNEPVVRHMRSDLACLEAEQTVGDALTMIRQEAPSGRFLYFYVLDHELRLVGVLPTRRLLLSPPDQKIAEIMITQVISIPDSATVLEACEFFTLHRLLAFPVVDARRRLVGVVDIELYTEELDDVEVRERSDELFQLAGVHLAEARQVSPWRRFLARFPWLLCNIGGGLVAAMLAELFSAELERVVALALFIPVVLALAESVSIQSVSLTQQTLRGRRPTFGEVLTKLRRELWTGGLLGLASGGSVALASLAWLGHSALALCLMLAIGLGITGAALIGVAIPNLLRLVTNDSRLAAGPIALASADIFTLILYFNLARWLL